MVKKEKIQVKECGVVAVQQVRVFLRYKGWLDSEIGQEGYANVLFAKERNDVSVAGSVEPDPSFFSKEAE